MRLKKKSFEILIDSCYIKHYIGHCCVVWSCQKIPVKFQNVPY